MWMGIVLIICSYIYSSLIAFIYFSKKRINVLETKLYGNLIIINLVNLIFELLCCFAVLNMDKMLFFTEFINRVFLLTIFMWQSVFTVYIYTISFKRKDDNKLDFNKKIGKVFLIFVFLVVIFLMVLPLYYYNDSEYVYSYGPSASLLYVIVIVYFVSWIIFYINKSNRDKKNKYLPVIAFIFVMAVALIIRGFQPGFLIISSSFALVTNLMFFTIENPDLKMINELDLAKKNAERANLAKTEFLSSMSHEIRTPLNAIVGFSNSILEDKTLKEAKEEARDIIMASGNLLEIVNGILDISKIEAGKMEIVNVDYKFVPMCNDIIKLIRPRISEKDIELKINYSVDIPGIFNGDMGKVKEIITNLLTNACKYTESGFISLDVNCINERDISKLVISVEDTGRGIETDKIDKLFTKFNRLDEDKNTTLEGTGLGLAITKSLVEMMGGKIIVQSKYGSGSKFIVYLSQKIVSMYDKEEIVKNEKKEESINYLNRRVLIVDDNNLNIKVALRMLKKYNLNLDTAISGYECIEKVDKNTYDLILMDDMMPKLSGSETLKKLKENKDFKIPIVILTANAISGMREKYISMGFNDYLAKPIDKIELERILNKFLDKE